MRAPQPPSKPNGTSEGGTPVLGELMQPGAQFPAVVLVFEDESRFDFFELLAACAFLLYQQAFGGMPGWKLIRGDTP